MEPIIGIVLRENNDNQKYLVLNQEICIAVSKYGGIPIGIYPNFENMNALLDMCNGFIMQGGDDFTDFDIKLVEKIKRRNIPLLGICLGMQTMGCLFDGNLNINIKHKSNLKYVHYVNVMKDTQLYKIFKKERILVNSRHFEYLENTSLKVSAISDDNIIEAIEDKNNKFFIGVQWHPESLIDNDINSNLLFKTFISTCKE